MKTRSKKIKNKVEHLWVFNGFTIAFGLDLNDQERYFVFDNFGLLAHMSASASGAFAYIERSLGI